MQRQATQKLQWRDRLAAFLLGIKADDPPLTMQGGTVVSTNTQATYPRYNARYYAQYGYSTNTTVYRAVNIIAQACASMDWVAYKASLGPKKLRVPIANHPLALLMQQPNKDKARTAFIEQLISYYMVAGTSYTLASFPNATYSPGDVPLALYNLRPDLVTQIGGPDGRVATYRYETGYDTQGRVKYIDYPAWKVMCLRFFNPLDELAGLSPIQVAAAVIERQNAGEEWNFQLMKNMARPSGAFVANTEFSDDARARLKREIYLKYGRGKTTAGMPILLENGLTYVQLAINPIDADWGNSDAAAGQKIASAIGVDPLLLNDKRYSTYNNALEAKLALWELTCFPIMDKLRDEVNGFLIPFYGRDVEADYDREPIESLKRNRQIESVTTLAEYNMGLRSFNDAAVDLSLGTIAESDDFYKFGPMFFVRRTEIAQFLNEMKNTWGLPGGGGAGVPPGAGSMGSIAKIPNITPSIHEPLLAAGNRYDQHQTKTDLAQLYTQIEAQRANWYPHMTQAIQQYFLDEAAIITQAMLHQKTLAAAKSAILAAVALHKEQLQIILAGYYASIADAAARNINLQFQAKTTIFTKQGIDVLGHYAATTINDITDTTQQQIIDVFTDASDQSQSVSDVAASLQDLYQGYQEDRAGIIAQNEAVYAYNAGSQVSAGQLGMPLLKTWLTARDNKVRPDHDDAEGQTVAFEDPYQIGSSQMMFPKDDSLGADDNEIINCRCTEIYSVDLSKDNPYRTVRVTEVRGSVERYSG